MKVKHKTRAYLEEFIIVGWTKMKLLTEYTKDTTGPQHKVEAMVIGGLNFRILEMEKLSVILNEF